MSKEEIIKILKSNSIEVHELGSNPPKVVTEEDFDKVAEEVIEMTRFLGET